MGSLRRGAFGALDRPPPLLTVLQVSVALAGGVMLKALHQRPNFYSAAVYLAQSSANLMVNHHPFHAVPRLLADSCDLDPHQPRLPNCLYISPRPPETPFRTPTTHRSRAALRESLVRRYRNMSRDDDLPWGNWRLVPRHVLQLAGGQSLGLDWRRAS